MPRQTSVPFAHAGAEAGQKQEARMKKVVLFVSLVMVAMVVSGCGLASSLMGGKGGTVSQLWPDVPPLPNATKANIDIPLPVTLIIQGFIQAANSDSSNDTKLDKFDFIVYQTADTPEQVAQFYTVDMMKNAGWNKDDTPGCASGAGAAAGFCVFGKQANANQGTALLIVPVQDDQTKQTQIFYVRFEGSKK